MVSEILKMDERFYADIISSAGVVRITIPKQIVDGADFKVGDKVKVEISKVNSGEKDEQ